MQRLTQTFDVNGNPLIQLTEVWQNNTWTNSYRNTYTYDANGNMLTYLDEQWQNNAWVNYVRGTYTYNANGNPLTYLEEEWQNNVWVNYGRTTSTYDTSGNRLTYLLEEWQNNAWVNEWRETYTYDVNENSITGKYDEWQSGNWEPGMGYLDLYSQKQYIYSLGEIYRYEANFIITTGIDDIQATNIGLSVFPNPANDKITIEISGETKAGSVAILNMEGQELIKQKISDRKTLIDIRNLLSGVYFVRLTNDRTVEVAKIIICN